MTITDLYIRLFGKGAVTDGSVIDMAEHARAGGTSADQGYKLVGNPPMNTKVTVVGPVTYVGVSAPGTAQSTAKWQCQKVDTTSGTVVTWADSGNYSQTSTDLTALTYS